jgi:hypothetical protein
MKNAYTFFTFAALNNIIYFLYKLKNIRMNETFLVCSARIRFFIVSPLTKSSVYFDCQLLLEYQIFKAWQSENKPISMEYKKNYPIFSITVAMKKTK